MLGGRFTNMPRVRVIFFSFLLIGTAVRIAPGCDLCGCYTPQMEAMSPAMNESDFAQPSPSGGDRRGWGSGAYFAVAEQFTRFRSTGAKSTIPPGDI
jgi:hypothetical protein